MVVEQCMRMPMCMRMPGPTNYQRPMGHAGFSFGSGHSNMSSGCSAATAAPMVSFFRSAMAQPSPPPRQNFQQQIATKASRTISHNNPNELLNIPPMTEWGAYVTESPFEMPGNH